MSSFDFISFDDYECRIKRLQEKLNELDLDAAIVCANSCTYENIRYLTGFWPMFERGGVCVPRKGQSIMLIGAEAPGLVKETVLGENYCIMSEFAHTFPIKWKGIEYTTFTQLFDKMSGGKGYKRIGLTDFSITTVQQYEGIKKAIGNNGEIIDISSIMRDFRRHKTDKEVALIREANKINEKVFGEFLGQVKPEMTEYQAQGLLLGGMYKYGAEAESFPTLFYAGERTMNQIGRGSHNIIGRNRLVDCDFGAMFGTYSSAYCRPFMFGKMPDKLKDEIKFVADIHVKLIDEWIKPGMAIADVQNRYVKAYMDKGYMYPSGASHGIGIFECEPPLMSQGEGVLEPNMTFAADHFFRGDGYGFRIEDCYVVTETGTEMFTRGYLEPIEL